jgi:hypothetical protein
MCNHCVSRKELCVYGSRTACKMCSQRKVRCSFLDERRKRRNEIDSEEDGEPAPKKPRNEVTRPSGPKPTVDIPVPLFPPNNSPITEMVGLLRELVEGVRDLTKVTRGVAGLGTQIYQQNAKLVRLGERQSYLAEKALRKGSGSGSEAGEEGAAKGDSEDEGAGTRKDKGKGKAVDETMRSDGETGSEEEEVEDARMQGDVGGSGTDSDTEK